MQCAAEFGQPHQHANAVVVLQCVTPKRIQALRTLGLPVCLVLIKVGRAGLAHLMGDGLTPRQPGMALGIVIEHLNQQWQLGHLGGRAQ